MSTESKGGAAKSRKGRTTKAPARPQKARQDKAVKSPGRKSSLKPKITVGRADEAKARKAQIAMGAGGMPRTAGMMLDGIGSLDFSYASGFAAEGYLNSYASGLGYKTGVYDIPMFVQIMNQKNGGIIHFPMTLPEKYSLFRYYARCDSLVGRALDLLSDLPVSKLSLHIPKYVPDGLKDEIKNFFEDQVVKLDLFNNCGHILYELNCIGQASMFAEWDEENTKWTRLQMLPPEEVFSFEIPFSDDVRIEYRPRRIISLIKKGSSPNDIEQDILDSIPDDIKSRVVDDGCILLDSNPMNGSFCHTIARRKAPYMDVSSSLLDRVLVPLQLRDYYKYTQLSLASRCMTPRNLITAPQCSQEALDDLRVQVDLSYLDPDYTIMCNYDVHWETIGVRDRLLELSSEYERLDNEIFSAMGVTRELLTGEGSYTNTKISVEILSSMFLRSREVLVDYIEQKLFKPICEKRKWYIQDGNGIKKYYYPKVGFNRLTIRDNSEVFDSLFQLYQKGSLPVEVIYDLFNLDASEIDDKLYQDLFTVRDPTFNDLVRSVLGDIGRKLSEESDITEKVCEYLRLKHTPPAEGGGDGMMGGFGDMFGGGDAGGGDLSSMFGMGDDGSGGSSGINTDEVDALVDNDLSGSEGTEGGGETKLDKEDNGIDGKAEEIASKLPSDADPEEIMEQIVKSQKKWGELSQKEQDAISDLVIRGLPEDYTDEDIVKQIIFKSRGV